MDIKIKSRLTKEIFNDKKFIEGCVLGLVMFWSGFILMFFSETRVMASMLIAFSLGFVSAIYSNYNNKKE
jgi:hypothetical protein